MKYLITGGCGFIGTNFADILLKRGDQVFIIDDLSRKGTELNLRFLLDEHQASDRFKFYQADLLSADDLLTDLLDQVDVVYHLAGQVAVTESVKNPYHDFNNNLLATFKLLEAVRLSKKKPSLIYASTNKVYGNLATLELTEEAKRYGFGQYPNGISEEQNLDFHSPYGCSKGAADQYVHDYARIYGLKTVVMRQSCIYGPHQFGVEDQGWVAWFIIASLLNKKLTLYGDGKQVRDLLHVNDLFEAWDLATQKIDQVSGKIYNLGGGTANSLSLLEFLDFLENALNKKINLEVVSWRPGDQKIFISDNFKAEQALDWQVKIDWQKGVSNLIEWVKNNQQQIEKMI